MAENSLTIILVEPQLGQNIGAVARGMLNFGLTDLRLVRPRDGWPNPEAVPRAAGADKVLKNVQVFPDTLSAIGDLNRVFATSSRVHDIIKVIYSPHTALEALTSTAREGGKVGILFGSERCGLTGEDLSLCEALIKIPNNPDFSSLNLAHAVVLVAYEWFLQVTSSPTQVFRTGKTRLATGDDLGKLFNHLEEELDHTGFLRHKKKRSTMVRNIRNIFQRAKLTQQEVRTLRGIIRSLVENKTSANKSAVKQDKAA